MADIFPNRTAGNFTPRSDPTEEYNCLGWAVHSQTDYIWPDKRGQFRWPADMPRNDTVESIKQFLERLGFTECLADGREYVVEPGQEKVAIYADKYGPQHIARQLPSGVWTSKFGEQIDAEHTAPNVVESPTYGHVVLVMKRASDGRPPRLPPMKPDRPTLVNVHGGPLRRP